MSDSSAEKIIEVALPLPVNRTFHYLLCEPAAAGELPGRRVLVPFRARKMIGYILSVPTESKFDRLKNAIELIDDEPLWRGGELQFFRWVSSYYLHPLGETLKSALPAGMRMKSAGGKSDAAGAPPLKTSKNIRFETFYTAVRSFPAKITGRKISEIHAFLTESGEVPVSDLRGRFGQCSAQLKRLTEIGAAKKEDREVYRDPFRDELFEPDVAKKLNAWQERSVESVISAVRSRKYAPFLLNGVTGSGKTEVYLQSIATVLENDLNALVLTPEISLTPQLVRRFRARFGNVIAVLHSALSDGERYDEWRRIRRGEARIVIGARSAIFAPLERIGIIVVDEEHDPSFKQSEGLRYNARDLALVRGKMENCVVILGSATPQIATLHAAEEGRLALLPLPERVGGGAMPTVEVVSMKGVKGHISPKLAAALSETVESGGQAMVFLNRRGFATILVCADCGTPLSCPNCSVALTWHRRRGESLCHYCGFAAPAPGVCAECGSLDLKDFGAGTERIEHELKELLPHARILRMDSDTTTTRGSHAGILSRMAERRGDILIGTQMIAKGHDFPGVTLVGIINGDGGLNIPDFRSGERTFQTLSQVMGRAGRGESAGKVVMQCLNPDHYALRCAISHDASGFYREEMEFRREAGYPPFSHLALLGFSGLDERAVEECAARGGGVLHELKRKLSARVELLGPSIAPLYRIRSRFRRRILLKSPLRNDLRRLLVAWSDAFETPRSIRRFIDIDPIDMS